MELSFLKPTDQPTGKLRLIHELRTGLSSKDLDEFWFIAAFAKLGPLLRLAKEIGRWRSRGNALRAVFGLDQRGTSREALEFAMEHFSEVRVVYASVAPFSPTFHPKMYVFAGATRGVAYIGSNNLTVGGTETNLETYVKIGLALPDETDVLSSILECWKDAAGSATPLTADLLADLVAADIVPGESRMRRPASGAGEQGKGSPKSRKKLAVPKLTVVPPSVVPRDGIVAEMKKAAANAKLGKEMAKAPLAAGSSLGAQVLVIQIIPHHNGEIFLSKTAIDQDPAFFGWPFTGHTVPKKASNPTYPQRVPDPVVTIVVYDDKGKAAMRYDGWNLNTVYYATKSEIRITVPPEVCRAAPEYSVMVMRQAEDVRDYDIEIYVPGGPRYNAHLALCNQTMPSGGKTVARKFGWI